MRWAEASSAGAKLCAKGLSLWFVAERRLNLARPFKAGFGKASKVRRDATRREGMGGVVLIPALKGRAKFKLPLRGENSEPPDPR